MLQMTKRIKKSRVWEKQILDGKIGRNTTGPSPSKAKAHINTLTECSLCILHFQQSAKLSLLSQLSDSKGWVLFWAKLPLSNDTTRMGRIPEAVPGSKPFLLLLINLFYIAFSMARKASFNYQQEWRSHKGKIRARELRLRWLHPGSYQSWYRGQAVQTPCWEPRAVCGRHRSVPGNCAGMNSQPGGFFSSSSFLFFRFREVEHQSCQRQDREDTTFMCRGPAWQSRMELWGGDGGTRRHWLKGSLKTLHKYWKLPSEPSYE